MPAAAATSANGAVTTSIGQRIRFLRDRRRLTQDELAIEVRVSGQTIRNWELGSSAPNAFVIPLLARALGVAIEGLFTYSTPQLGDARPAGDDRIASLERRVAELEQLLAPLRLGLPARCGEWAGRFVA
jgi:transcriptional regulator with XRE-family HTH domain